ncbi:MAG: NAD(P)-dependent oxidoreductase [Acidimicrobiia bacterium]
MTGVRVYNQLGQYAAARIAAVSPAVEVVELPWDAAIPDVDAEVLFGGFGGNGGAQAALDRGCVRWLHMESTGVDKVPDAWFDLGITVTCARGVHAVPIAEFAVACILEHEKRMPEIWVHEPHDPMAFTLGQLSGCTVGIVGFGGIGAACAQRLLPFGVRVKALRRTGVESPVHGVEMVTSLDAVLADADHVVLAAPLTDATRRMIDDATFAAMKPGVHLVNVARGELVDHDALRRALDANVVARASLDVTDPEPPPEGHWLYSHPKVFVSPHVSWSSPEGFGPIIDGFCAELARYLRGEPLLGVVDPIERY